MQIVLSEMEYCQLKGKADLLQCIIDDCSSDGVFYTKGLEKYTTRIAKYMAFNKPNCVGYYRNCKIIND